MRRVASDAQVAEPLKQVWQRAAVLIAFDGASKALALLASIWVARAFGPDGFGALSVAQSVAMAAQIVATCGLESWAVRAAVASPQRSLQLASTVMRLRLALGAVVIAALLGGAALAGPRQGIGLLVVVYGLSAWTGALSLQWLTQSGRATHVMGAAQVLAQGVYLGLVVLLASRTSERLWVVPAALIAGELVAAAVNFGWVRRRLGALPPAASWRETLAMLREAAPLAASQAFRAVGFASDLVIAGLLLPIAVAGLYGAALKVFQVGISAASLYLIVALPRLVRVRENDPADLPRQLHRSMAVLTLSALPPLLLVGIAGEPIMAAVFGADFAGAIAPLRWLLLQWLFYALLSHYRNALLVEERQGLDTTLVGIGAFAHVGLKYLGGASAGMIGIAIGGALAEGLLLVAYALVFGRVRRRARAPAAGQSSRCSAAPRRVR